MADTRLSVAVTTASGQTTRWGPNELDSADVPTGISFSTGMPGGFRDASINLPRRADLEWADLDLFNDVQILGPGNEVVWEGRIQTLPRSHGDDFSIQVGCAGWSAHLKDDPSFQMVYVDRDPQSWGEITLERRLENVTAAAPMDNDFTAEVNPRNLHFEAVTNKGILNGSRAELMYIMPPSLTIAKIMYRADESNETNIEAPILRTDDNPALSSPVSLNLTADDTLRTGTVVTPERYGMLRGANSSGSTQNKANPFSRTFKKIAVYADHGLTSRANGNEAEGFYASDVIADILSRAAPLLVYSTGEGGSIEATSFVIPHLVFKEPVTAEDAISQTNIFNLYDWGVFKDREFFFRSSDPDRLTWEARLSEGAILNLEGEAGEEVFNGVVVRYTDLEGNQKTVGPTGSNTDLTDASLADTDSSNPVNAHGITRKWGIIDVSQVTTSDGAIQLGARWLEEQALPQRKGSIELRGSVRHPTKGMRPAWSVWAGDYIRISDHPADVPRKVVETSYSHDTRTASLTLDNAANTIEAFFERLGVSMVGRVGAG